jgi:hypothetical protein
LVCWPGTFFVPLPVIRRPVAQAVAMQRNAAEKSRPQTIQSPGYLADIPLLDWSNVSQTGEMPQVFCF